MREFGGNGRETPRSAYDRFGRWLWIWVKWFGRVAGVRLPFPSRRRRRGPGGRPPMPDLDPGLRAAAPAVLRWYAERMRLAAAMQPDGQPACWPWTGYLLAAGTAERAAREIEGAAAGLPEDPDAAT